MIKDTRGKNEKRVAFGGTRRSKSVKERDGKKGDESTEAMKIGLWDRQERGRATLIQTSADKNASVSNWKMTEAQLSDLE